MPPFCKLPRYERDEKRGRGRERTNRLEEGRVGWKEEQRLGYKGKSGSKSDVVASWAKAIWSINLLK